VSDTKIYINGKFLNQQSTGVQAYALGMLDAMREQNISFEVLVPKSVALSDRWPTKQIGVFSNPVLWEQLSLPLYLYKQKNALLINFCNSAPLFCKQQIVTIHDLAFEQKKQKWFSFWFTMWYRFLIPRICKTSKFIFTVSDFSMQEIISCYNVKKDKIKIIPNGISKHISPAVRIIKDDYILLIGGNNQRKNPRFVINQLTEIEKLGLKLVIINSKESVFKNNQIVIHPSIIYMDYVDTPSYYSLIKYSKALVYSSLYEGFGIPILESLCLKTPVVCSDLAVFKESFGTLPLYFKSNDSLSFINALEKSSGHIISDTDVENLKRKYSFDESVSLILKILKEL
jgi:glycosyltransferase involved in cell wall biosynthesis